MPRDEWVEIIRQREREKELAAWGLYMPNVGRASLPEIENVISLFKIFLPGRPGLSGGERG